MLSSSLNFDHSIIAHMEGRSERKWKTLRHIGSPQEESEGADVELSPGEVEEVEEVEEAIRFVDYGGEAPVTGEVVESEPEEPAAVEVEPEERVLIVMPVASTTRLIRETIKNFTNAEVVSTSDALRGFELALQQSYEIFVFGMQTGELSGPMLYELISKAYTTGHGPKRLAPGVIFIRESGDPKLPTELTRDVRVKDTISKPVRIDRLLKAVGCAVEVLDPTAR
ncbi:MAG: hypothetical protein P1U68_10355 [Verrucomicrobiales bacterium]|nr:hypothetical protein [Verrucomicrobiales bacterium]